MAPEKFERAPSRPSFSFKDPPYSFCREPPQAQSNLTGALPWRLPPSFYTDVCYAALYLHASYRS
jgi:hypothetical protein